MTKERTLIPDEKSLIFYKLKSPNDSQKDLEIAREEKVGIVLRAVYRLPATASKSQLRDAQELAVAERAKRMRERI